ncbi:MAG: hypothetical protein EAY69_09575 [Cytophagales bacterium]|nr:MAG: hypothetical protein EAY69_09575 [Cytophagales bacterium]
MKTYFFKLLLVIIFSQLSIVNLYAQGCSDAGFCTMGAMKPAQSFQKEKLLRVRGIEVSQYMGNTKLKQILVLEKKTIKLFKLKFLIIM